MSVTSPLGFTAAGVVAGIKSSGGPDMALVVNMGTASASSAAAVFTPNRFRAAPVLWSQNVMSGPHLPRAVVLNSGGANACTGQPGYEDSAATAKAVGAALHLAPEQVLVCSTGLIGERLPLDKISAGVTKAAGILSKNGGPDAALGIMTTDTVPKTVEVSMKVGEATVIVGGMAKGAGMLAPALATMLVVLTTDAVLDSAVAQRCVEYATSHSFNRIDSDGCQSTNDTVILLGSGVSGVSPDEDAFTQLLTTACQDLARQLIGDAEGASHDIEITVTNASTEGAALLAARAIARSNLFKCAIAGNDPNWGRIVSELGTLSPDAVPYDPAHVNVSINGVMICRGGGMGEPRNRVDLASSRQVAVLVDLAAGDAEATVLTNDLTHEYVSINSDYSS